MKENGTLRYCEEALRHIDRIPDPITRSFVNMAFVHMVKRTQLEQRDFPRCDVDMLYLVTSLEEYFSEHDVIARTLAGERVGAWFEDES